MGFNVRRYAVHKLKPAAPRYFRVALSRNVRTYEKAHRTADFHIPGVSTESSAFLLAPHPIASARQPQLNTVTVQCATASI